MKTNYPILIVGVIFVVAISAIIWRYVFISGESTCSTCPCIDYDGNGYPTLTLGDQVWMAENLRVTHYSNGDAIPNVIDAIAYEALTTGAYSWYDNDQSIYSLYGALYNWYAVNDSRGLCPDGWHVPDDTEWSTLLNHLGGTETAAGKMKSNSDLWDSPNSEATNTSGFSGLPGGARDQNGNFSTIGISGHWWTSTEASDGFAWTYHINHAPPENYGLTVRRISNYTRAGFSVRCLKD